MVGREEEGVWVAKEEVWEEREAGRVVGATEAVGTATGGTEAA